MSRNKVICGMCICAMLGSVVLGCSKRPVIEDDFTSGIQESSSQEEISNGTTQATTQTTPATQEQTTYSAINVKRPDLSGVGVNFNDGKPFSYNGGTVCMDVSFNAKKTNVGIMVFANGVPQKIHTNYDSKDVYVTDLLYSDTNEGKVKLYFTPNVGKSGETVDVYVAFMTYPYPEMINPYPIGPYSAAVSTVFGAYKFEMVQDAKITETDAMQLMPIELTEEEYNSLVYVTSGGKTINKLLQFSFNVDNETIFVEDNRFEYGVDMKGGSNLEYYATVFINHIPYKSYEFKIEDKKHKYSIDEMIEVTDEFIKQYNITEYNTIHTIAVAKNGSYNDVVQSSNKVIVYK